MSEVARETTTCVRVPGSTSNLGPGFDCMGVALRIYNHVTIKRVPREEPGSPLLVPRHPMAEATAKCFFSRSGQRAGQTFRWAVRGNVPVSRGLGSSVTLRLGILQGLNAMNGRPFGRRQLFDICRELEGHPDNASAGLFGGFNLTTAGGTHFRFEVDDSLVFVLLIPEREIGTDASRGVLPGQLPRHTAVRSVGNACGIVAAFATRDYEKLRGCFDDGMHQPYRSDANPGLSSVIKAGVAAGAYGGFLSGSGSAIACVSAPERAEAAGEAMLDAYAAVGPARICMTTVDNGGAGFSQDP